MQTKPVGSASIAEKRRSSSWNPGDMGDTGESWAEDARHFGVN